MISPDLTRNDGSRMASSGGLTPDNIGVEYAGSLTAIAESPRGRGILWTGSNDGLIYLSTDGGATWKNVTPGPPELRWLTISHIEPSRWDAASAYVAVDGHQMNNRDPLVYRTTDYGRTWRLIVEGVPKSPHSYAHIIREDPVRRGLLYLGTENAVYVSLDDGARWRPLQNNLPHVPVYGMVVQPHFNDLVVGTYGRGFWILDDVTPLQQLTPDVTARAAHLFAPRPAWRLRGREAIVAPLDDPVAGVNPSYGAPLSYWIRDSAGDSVTLRIADPMGRVVRTLRGPGSAGINRVWWNLREEPSREARLRTKPLHAPDVQLNDQGWRPAPDVDQISILAAPGRYRVTLVAAGREYGQSLEVRKDPTSAGTEQDIASQIELWRSVRSELERVVDMVNGLESLRARLQTLAAALEDGGPGAPPAARADRTLRVAVEALDVKARSIEDSLVQLELTGRGQDFLRWPARLASRLGYLANSVGSSDRPPTAQQREVFAILREEAVRLRAAYERLLSVEVPALNDRFRGAGVGVIAKPGS